MSSSACKVAAVSTCLSCSLPSLRMVKCHAKVPHDSASATGTVPRTRNGSMIRSLAAAVELNGQVQKYETFAGRSAMVGVAVAACIEVITDHSVFFPVKDDTALTYACVALATLAAAVGVAVTRGRSDSPTSGTGSEILESVYASLTAVQRSAASVTQAQVDKAVDSFLECAVFEGRFDSFSIEGLLSHSDEEC